MAFTILLNFDLESTKPSPPNFEWTKSELTQTSKWPLTWSFSLINCYMISNLAPKNIIIAR